MSKQVVYLKEEHFFKAQQGIERANMTNPVEKVLVMALDEINPQSPSAGVLLREYYRKIEITPNRGISELEFSLLIKNNQNSDSTFICHYCQEEHDIKTVTIDHFKPQMFRGKNQYFNLRLSCFKCNTMKGAIHPERMPNVYSFFLCKSRNKEYSSCIKILLEAKELYYGKDMVESKLIDKLLNTEIFWRIKNGKSLPEELKGKEQELLESVS